VVVVAGATIEGSPGGTSYFIEPEVAGDWHIALEIEQEHFDPIKETSDHRSERYVASVVRRVEVPKDGMGVGAQIPDKERRSATSYRLMLIDREGKILQEL
jgi:hypothetical protein